VAARSAVLAAAQSAVLAGAQSPLLAGAQSAVPAAGFVCGDAAALPLAADVADVTLAPHMLYHVPDRLAAVREFRRITRPGGQVLVVLNAPDHLAEFHGVVDSAAADIGEPAGPAWVEVRTDDHGLNLDSGRRLLAGQFGAVERHDFASDLVVPGPEPLTDYVASMRYTQSLPSPERLVAAVARRLPAGEFRIRTHCGVLVCR
jgi:SAM-dependent methyltransferase